MIWEIDRVHINSGARDDEEKRDWLLANGWEPFAVTPSRSGPWVYHFRRRVET